MVSPWRNDLICPSRLHILTVTRDCFLFFPHYYNTVERMSSGISFHSNAFFSHFSTETIISLANHRTGFLDPVEKKDTFLSCKVRIIINRLISEQGLYDLSITSA